MSSTLVPVILGGGSGSRLWPLSREDYPKQFLKINDDKLTLLQKTINRLSSLKCAVPLVISNEAHRFIVAEQLREINMLNNNIILEPFGRNTAPAICIAALTLLKKKTENDPILLVLAADHAINDEIGFCNAILNSHEFAESGKLVTFGIKPTYAETGYGYIHKGDAIDNRNSISVHKVRTFVEKPDEVQAQHYVDSNEYCWNSGMFMFKASRYIDELRKYRPDILDACMASLDSANLDLDFIRLDSNSFETCPADSIDYAIMEKTEDAIVVSLDIGWNDIGSWSSLWDIADKNNHGNVEFGDVISVESFNNLIHSESCLVTLLDVHDLVIVQTKDAILVANRYKMQGVKKIVEQIKSMNRKEYRVHREVFRPWGHYDSIGSGERYQVKQITVNPGEGLSTQLHYHRVEHWIIVAGTARVTIDTDVKILTENESIYIPSGVVHCLENPGLIPLEVVEVRSGSYLEEDDIIRLSDRYNRGRK